MKSLEKLYEVALTRDVRYYLLLHRAMFIFLLYASGVRLLRETKYAENLRIILNSF